MRLSTKRIVSATLIALSLAGCGGSSSQGISNSQPANGQNWYFGADSTGGPSGGPNGVVPPGTGQPTDFGPGGGGGGGTTGGGGGTPTPPPPDGPSLFSDFIYIPNPPDSGGGNLAVLGVDSNGVLSNVAVDRDLSRPVLVVRSPDGRFLYVLDASSTRFIRTYSVNATTGAITALTPEITTSQLAGGLVFTPDGRFAYLSEPTLGTTPASPGIIVFAVGSDGRLTPAGAPYSSTIRYNSLTPSPDGRYLYAVAQSGSLTQFAIDPTSGGLTFVRTQTSDGGRPFDLKFDQSGTLAFVAYGNELYITRYSVDSSTGQLTRLGDTPTQSNSYGVVLHPTLPVLYVTEYLGVVETFAFTPTGDTTPLGASFRIPGLGVSLTFTEDARFAYFTSYFTDQIVAYSVGADGVLTQIAVYEDSDLDNVLDSPRGGVSIPAAKRLLDREADVE